MLPPPPGSSLCGENSEEKPPQKKDRRETGNLDEGAEIHVRTMSKQGILVPGLCKTWRGDLGPAWMWCLIFYRKVMWGKRQLLETFSVYL